MTEQSSSPYPPAPRDADTAPAQARQVAETAASASSAVAQTAKDEAAHVAAEAKHQASLLLDTVRGEVGQQAGAQQQRIAEALHSLSKELGSMASSAPESGVLTGLAHEAARRGGEIAHWLEVREPAEVMEATRTYARRRPVAFLAWCGAAGVLAGRLTRGAAANRADSDGHNPSLSQVDRPYPSGDQPSHPVHQSPPQGELSGTGLADGERLMSGREPAGMPPQWAGTGPVSQGGEPLR